MTHPVITFIKCRTHIASVYTIVQMSKDAIWRSVINRTHNLDLGDLTSR